MKLMIEINDNEYMGIKEYPNNITSYPVTIHLYDAVRNGIPLEQDPKTDTLDKIRADIEQTTSRYTISRERGAMGQVEWSDRLIKESEVLEILDKYKAGSEE